MELKNVRQNVFRYLAQINISAKLDDCMALIIAEILGYINKKNADNYKPWADICFRIKNYNTLNKTGLLEKIKTEILQNFTLEKKRELLETKAIYALDMDEIIFTEKFIEDTKNQTYLLRTNYGGKDYSTATINTTLAPFQKNINATKATTKIDFLICQEETELNNFWKSLVTEERKKLFPFWKWRISKDEFKSLEEKFLALLNSMNINNIIENHAFKLALIYSEWYKREFTGKDSVFKYYSAQSIWRYLSVDIQKNFLITINESIRWDDSLKLLGGLPLSYLTRGGNNSSRVFAKVFNDYKDEKELDLNELDVNNQAMRQSVKSGGSINEYLIEMINENFPFAETDKEEPPFKDFIVFVKTGLKEYKRNTLKKFSVFWQVRQHTDFVYIYPTICVKLKPEENREDHRFINDKRLNDWGIQGQLSSFEMVIKMKYSDKEEPIEKGGFYFNRCTNGKFLCRSGIIWKICNNPKNLESIEFVLKSSQLEITIQAEKVPNYIQLWNSGYGEWSNRQINGARSSVLFLNDNVSTKEGDQQIPVKSKEKEYYWAIVHKELEIIDNGKPHKLYQKHGAIEVYPQNKDLFKNAIRYNDDGMLSHVVEETTSFVYIVKEPVTFNVSFFDSKGSSKVLNNSDDYKVQYIKPDMKGFEPYLFETSLIQGFVKFKIIHNEIYEGTLDCYVLKSEANISRITDTKRVKFKNIDTLELINNEFVDDENNIEDDTVNIKIGKSDNYLELPVFRALNRKNDVFMDGKLIDNITDIIPLIFAKRIEVRKINNDGVLRKVKEIEKTHALRVIYNNTRKIETDLNKVDKKNGLTTYTKLIQEENKIFFLAKGNMDKQLEEFSRYHFYFLSLKNNKVKQIEINRFNENDQNYFGFKIIEDTDGIVFQSLEGDNLLYQETYRPFFVSTQRVNIKIHAQITERKQRLKDYALNPKFNLAIVHFNVAVKYNLYFGTFDILVAMEKNPAQLAQFYLYYYHDCLDQKRPIDYAALHRLAEEMLFNWMLIPRIIWIEVIEKEKGKNDWVTNLFKNKEISHGPEQFALSGCCEKYWSSLLTATNQNHEIFTYIKRVRKVDSFFCQKPEDKIKVLIELDKTERLYANLLEILQK